MQIVWAIDFKFFAIFNKQVHSKVSLLFAVVLFHLSEYYKSMSLLNTGSIEIQNLLEINFILPTLPVLFYYNIISTTTQI